MTAAQEWLDETSTARWSTESEASRMGKSGYAPRKAELAEMVVTGRRVVQDLDRAFRQACMNLATIRPDLTRENFSLADQADLYYDALLAGWGGIEGYDRGRTPKAIE